MLFLQLLELSLGLDHIIRLRLVVFSDEHFFFCGLDQLLIEFLKLVLLGFYFLADLVIALAELLKGHGHFLLFGIATFPSGYEVAGLKQSVPLHVRYFPLMLLGLRNVVFMLEFLHYRSDIRRSRRATAHVVLGLGVGETARSL